MYKWLHATVLEGINTFVNYILEYINLEVASCHSIRGINISINYILEYINV
jgi:hypothetical protein